LPRRLVVHPALSSWTSGSSTHRVWVWRALVADEDRVVRQILSHELSIAGWEVLLARDGEEARRLIDLHTPDVVVTDAELPLRTGLELLEDAEHMEAGLRPRFIVLSGQDPDEMAIRALELGAADFVSKPFHPGIVVRRLARLRGDQRRE
jgi:DNA-binding response OmpR family regulator